MHGIERLVTREHRPEDARVLVGQSNDRSLPTHAQLELHQPAADAVTALARGHHGGLRALDQQRAQIVVAVLRDRPETGLAARGLLARREAWPSAELTHVGVVLRLQVGASGADHAASVERGVCTLARALICSCRQYGR
jgi:hypothetical protein